MVKYELVKNGTEVKMTKVDPVTDDSAAGNLHSFDKDTKTLTTYNNTTGTTKVVSGNAVAFVYDTTNTKWKVLDANNIKDVTANNNTDAYVATDDGKVVAFSLISNNAPAAAGSSTAYGYVTGKIETKNGDDKVTELSVWNGSETVTVKVDGTATAVKGDSNTKVIGVNVEDTKGSTNNAITAFTKVSGQDYLNAKIAYENDGTTKVIKAIFVDEKNNINYAGSTGAAGTAYTVANATTVQAAGLTVTATADKAAAISGETVTYTVKVSGTASADAANDTITLALANLTGAGTLAAVGTPANCTVATLVITITNNSAATSGTFTVSSTVTGNVTATLTHAAV